MPHRAPNFHVGAGLVILVPVMVDLILEVVVGDLVRQRRCQPCEIFPCHPKPPTVVTAFICFRPGHGEPMVVSAIKVPDVGLAAGPD